MFKVVSDQLKVSQGWVRCGHCAEVFDASKYLLSREASKAFSSVAAAPAENRDSHPLGDGASTGAADAVAKEDADRLQTVAAVDDIGAAGATVRQGGSSPRWGAGSRSQVDTAPAELLDDAGSAADFDPAGWKEALQKRQLLEDGAASAFSVLAYSNSLSRTASDFVGLADGLPADELPRRPDLVRTATVSEAEFDEDLDALPPVGVEEKNELSFVLDAERRGFWKRPLVRGMLLGFSMVLVVSLGLQWVLHQKDSLSASGPTAEAALQTLCSALGCRIQPPRHVESLVIDSSTFNKIAADVYRLSFVLKNTGNQPLEMPALELTLTDTQDQAVVRRVLLPAQFGVGSSTLAARAEVPGVVSLRVMGEGVRTDATASSNASVSLPPAANSLRVAGYRVLAFYP
jgi:predicted Zn finger-like uncharacterized protein